MNLLLKSCYFCGGKYEKVVMPKEMDGYVVSTAIINKVGTDKIFMAKSLAYSCSTCGNVQTFLEGELQI